MKVIEVPLLNARVQTVELMWKIELLLVHFLATENNMVDATKRPLRIPPEFSTYAEQHGIFDLYKVIKR